MGFKSQMCLERECNDPDKRKHVFPVNLLNYFRGLNGCHLGEILTSRLWSHECAWPAVSGWKEGMFGESHGAECGWDKERESSIQSSDARGAPQSCLLEARPSHTGLRALPSPLPLHQHRSSLPSTRGITVPIFITAQSEIGELGGSACSNEE